MATFENACILDDPLADIASFELELDSTERLSQNALSLSGLSIRLPAPFIEGLVLNAFLLGDTSPFDGFGSTHEDVCS